MSFVTSNINLNQQATISSQKPNEENTPSTQTQVAEIAQKSIAEGSKSVASSMSSMSSEPSSPLLSDDKEPETLSNNNSNDIDDPLIGLDSTESESENVSLSTMRTNPCPRRREAALRRSSKSFQSPQSTPQVPSRHHMPKQAHSAPIPTPPQRYRAQDASLNRSWLDLQSSARASPAVSSSSTPRPIHSEEEAPLSQQAIDQFFANQTRILSLISFAIFGTTIVVPLIATGALPAGCAIATAGVCATAINLGASEEGRVLESEIEEIKNQMQTRYALILDITHTLANRNQDPEVVAANKAALQEHLQQYQMLLEQLSGISTARTYSTRVETTSSVASFILAAGPAAASSSISFIDLDRILDTLGNIASTYGIGSDIMDFISRNVTRQQRSNLAL